MRPLPILLSCLAAVGVVGSAVAAPPRPLPGETLLLHDDFSPASPSWGATTHDASIRNGRLSLSGVPHVNHLFPVPARSDDAHGLRIVATARLTAGDATASVGLACFAGRVHYSLQVSIDGRFWIIRSTARAARTLAQGKAPREFGKRPIRLEARCRPLTAGRARLLLFADARRLIAVTVKDPRLRRFDLAALGVAAEATRARATFDDVSLFATA